jgi:hypothetical protein
MNTGILDAVNLGWKLAFASDDREHTALLDSYEQERRPVARQVLALTHLIFFAEASANVVPAFLRGTVVPLAAPVFPLLLKQRMLMAMVVRLLSQGWVNYRQSTLSVEGRPGGRGPRPGDRLPDSDISIDGPRIRLHELTARAAVSVLLERDAGPIDETLLGPHVAVNRIGNWPGRGLVAVRPDGHVGFRCGAADAAQLGAWLELIGAR